MSGLASTQLPAKSPMQQESSIKVYAKQLPSCPMCQALSASLDLVLLFSPAAVKLQL
jgi:hypothetical protein